ncbi:alpha/beta-hydrolase lipase region domain-containing protein [Phthorimaea operculella]|nr:alpha/beta-hydrolase lipase region domain-containing protein [Phthorimaea operculella]
MLCRVLLLSALVAASAGGRAPHADDILELRKTLGSRIPEHVFEDAMLDVPGLIAKYGYPMETHKVTTSDGYILTMHRIPHGRDRHGQPGRRPAVLLMHGLLSSSADWLVLGPGRALAYLLAEEGYDVWMGNARGNYYSREHQRRTMDPDRSTSYWRFSWEEIGLYDLTAFVDHILATTGEAQVDYIGHSQGGTSFVVLNSLKPEYNAKFRSFQGLAPAVYFENNEHELYNMLAAYEKIIETVALTLGIGEILTKQQAASLIRSRLCDGADVFDPVCVGTIQAGSATFGNKNESLIPLFLSHAPAGASVRQIAHFGQVIRRGVFARFHHNAAQNLLLYGRVTPPENQIAHFGQVIRRGVSARFHHNAAQNLLLYGRVTPPEYQVDLYTTDPSGRSRTSGRQIAHFGQVIRRGVFARFHHNAARNLLLYGRVTPPEYQIAHFGQVIRRGVFARFHHNAAQNLLLYGRVTPPEYQIAHFGQVIRRGVFARFDHNAELNLLLYGRVTPPEYQADRALRAGDPARSLRKIPPQRRAEPVTLRTRHPARVPGNLCPIRQIAHFGQVIRPGVFARFHHNAAQNLLLYGRVTPPEYQVSRVVTPTFLYYGLADMEVHHKDVALLAARLGNVVQVVRMQRPDFNHFAFIWGNNVETELYEKLIRNMKTML